MSGTGSTSGTTLVVQRFASPAAFLSRAGEYLAQAEVENALILGVARDLAGKTGERKLEPYFACVQEGTQILLCAFRSLPDKAGITRAADPAAVRLLAKDLRDACPEVREIVGPEPTITEFAKAFAEFHGRRVERTRRSRIHVLRKVIPVGSPPGGALRRGADADSERVLRWLREFETEVGEGGSEGRVERWLKEEKIYFWEDAGTTVSVALATGKTPTGIRISFVYTPPRHRRRGYASACVASLSQRLLDQGNEYCCLYTDLANPTSNKIYREIGYEPVCDTASYALAP